MTQQAQWWEWPQRLSRAWWELAFHPSAYIHPDQVKHRLGATWPWHAGAVSSRTVISRCHLQPVALADWSAPEVRAVLLPREVLQEWSLLLAAAHESTALAHLVRQADLQAVQEVLSLDDWAWAVGLPAQRSQPRQMIPAPGTASAWVERLRQQAHRLLGRWMAELPASLRERLALKWPPDAFEHAWSDTAPGVPQALLHAAYERLVNRWDPTWEADWSRALAPRA